MFFFSSKITSPIIKYILLLLAGNCFFFFLHFLGNQLPYDLAKQRFANAFEYENLSEKVYYNSEDDMKSTRNLVGIEHFIECQIARVILGGSQSRKDFRGSIKDAVILKVGIPLEKQLEGNCKRLKAMVVDNSKDKLGIIKTRYQWGYKAVYAILLRWFSVFQIREITKVLTYFAYLVLSLVIVSLSRKLFLVFLPVIIFGFFFSSIPQFPTLGNALGYLWSLITAIILAWQIKRKFSQKNIRVFSFVAGMISSYVWFLDGHLSFIIPMIGFVVYFCLRFQNVSVNDSYKMTGKCLLLFVTGFLACYFCNQMLKALFLDWQVVIVDTFLEHGIFKKLGHFSSKRIVGFDLLLYTTKVSFLGMKFLASAIASFSVLIFIFFIGIFLVDRRRKKYLWDLFFLLACILYTGLMLFFPHDNVYQHQRFVFLPFAFSWSCVIWIWQNIRARKIITRR